MNLFPNTSRKLRADFESRGIALDSMGTYVLKKLDRDELDHLETVDFRTLQWRAEDSVVVVDSGKVRPGCLVRVVRLSEDGRYLRFGIKYLSPRLVRAEPLSVRAFVRSIQSKPAIKIRKVRKGSQEYAGVLYGSLRSSYASLIALQDGKLIAVDIEPRDLSHSNEYTQILEEQSAEGEVVKQQLLERFG